MELEEKVEVIEKVEVTRTPQQYQCPECGSTHIQVSGHCATCFNCGWSLCSM